MSTGTILLLVLVIGAPLLMMLTHRGGHGLGGCGGHNHGGHGESGTHGGDPQSDRETDRTAR